jgi:septum formation protein
MIVLGSRSLRRRELLAYLVGEERIAVRPPLDAAEAGFDGLQSVDELASRLTEIARRKNDDVRTQLEAEGAISRVAAILTADTIIVVTGDDCRLLVLGQPPSDEHWADVVREWFTKYLLHSPHLAMTALCITTPAGDRKEQVVTSRVTFRPDAAAWLDWYLRTGEPGGKAGGYGLQGAGSLFVERIEGSPSNVIGLPLLETMEALHALSVER